MGTWNYRIVKRRDGCWAIHEVHYDDLGRAVAMTREPCIFLGDSKVDVRQALQMALDDSWDRLPFIEPEEGAWPVREDIPYGKGVEWEENVEQGVRSEAEQKREDDHEGIL